MKTLVKNGHLILDSYTECEGDLLLEDGWVKEVLFQEMTEPVDEVIDASGMDVYPGFVDIHLHGAMGKDFIVGSEAIDAVSQNVLADGTTAFMASLTVLSHEEELKTLKSLASHEEKGAVCLGVHMEGPYLSKEYKALMDERYLRDPSLDELEEMIQASNNSIRIMTVAPERKGMDKFIPALVEAGIFPMIGHTACTCEQAQEALLWGAKGFTHLYNAMTQHTHRDPGCVTAAFLSEGSYKEMICDGFHTDPKVVEMTYKALGPHQIILITDAMLGKGMPDGDYTFSGLACHKEGVHVRVKETGRIAGSAFGMIDAFHFMQNLVHPSKPELCALTSGNASLLLGDKTRGNLRPQARADLVLIDEKQSVHGTMVQGRYFSRT